MLDHVLGRPSVKSRRLQVLAVLAFWSVYLFRGHRHGPPLARFLSKLSSKRLTAWQTVVITMMYLYAARHFSTLVGLASPEPMANMYDKAYFRATWVLTALDAGFWTAMRIRKKWLRDMASMVFSLFYLVAAERADEKVRKVRGMLTVEHLRVSWDKGTTPYLRTLQNLVRPRFTRWPPRAIRIPRPATSDYQEPVSGWLYYDGPISDLQQIDKMILDIPGGGFVAMSPRCNDDKLFAWAGKTSLPILSLDYKKAPEFPYPYALNECYDVYTTIIKTKGRCVGMSGRETPKVVVTGDSAGGNLATAMTLMIIESTAANRRPSLAQADIPVPDGLVLLYPGLDMNIGNWMSDEQMSLIKDRRMRATNRDYLRRKSMQYNDVAGTPHETANEEEYPFSQLPGSKPANGQSITATATASETAAAEDGDAIRSPKPEYSHANRQVWPKTQQFSLQPPPPPPATATGSPQPLAPRPQPQPPQKRKSLSHRPEPLRTRLAMASMISYFNDRVLTPEMMRAMIILYIGPHSRPDFSRDYLLSPILAPDALLQRFPKTHFLTGERDPLVDDTVIFAGRLRRAKQAVHSQRRQQWEQKQRRQQQQGANNFDDDVDAVAEDGADVVEDFDEKDVAEVVLIPGISHGFSQFPTLYPPAWKLINRCARWAVDLLNAAEARDRLPGTVVTAPGAQQQHEILLPRQQQPHHVRTESSGDEDRPLEISMTRMRARTVSDAPREKARGAGSGMGLEGKVGGGDGNGSGGGDQEEQQQTQHRQQKQSSQQAQKGDEEGEERQKQEEEDEQTRRYSQTDSSRAAANGNGAAAAAAAGSRRKRTKFGNKSKSIIKLDSSDDLLGRRMQGLASSLTGTHDDAD
ncbi:Alpha/Beta hydrolase protein [Xylariaceae sp. FL0804]|nr:Alpha/Beta hydrolase protein [Xylariaceae sp. FL0804]